jgi:hypothetical protein
MGAQAPMSLNYLNKPRLFIADKTHFAIDLTDNPSENQILISSAKQKHEWTSLRAL